MEQTAAEPIVFLCYAREDFQRVAALYSLLKELGMRPWMDKSSILPGARWESEIERAVGKCDFFVACLSTRSVQRKGTWKKNTGSRSTPRCGGRPQPSL